MNRKKPSKKQTFLHDLVNHTHGLLLFLNQKKRLGKMELTEIEQLIKELKLMQNFIRIEGEFFHKDVSEFDLEVGIEEILKISKSLVSVYFAEGVVELKTNIGQLKLNTTDNFRFNSVLYYRVFTNIIKNISEANPTSVEIIFLFNEEGVLSIETKNDFQYKVDEKGQVRIPVGLFSIKSLLDKVGGSFESNSTTFIWTNSILIPFNFSSSNTQKAA